MATLGELITQTMFGSTDNVDMIGAHVRSLPGNKVAMTDLATQASVKYGITVKQAKVLIRLTAQLWDTEVP